MESILKDPRERCFQKSNQRNEVEAFAEEIIKEIIQKGFSLYQLKILPEVLENIIPYKLEDILLEKKIL